MVVVETRGLSLIGGAIGGFIFLYLYSRKKKIKFFHFADILSLAGTLALIFIKIGQQLGGAAHGTETNSYLKVRIIGRPGFYHPTELYEAFTYLLLFILLLILLRRAWRKKWKEGIIFAIFAFFTGVSIFGLEFLKVHRVYLYGLSFRQILALMIITGSIFLFAGRSEIYKKFLNYFKKKKNEVSQRVA